MTTSSVSPTLASPGIGSGLNVNSIVSGLMAVESQPLTAVNNKITADQAEVSAYGSLSSALSTFQTAISSLSDASSLNAQTVTSSDPSVTATADGTATLGNYNISVTQLAQQQKLQLAGVANTTDTIGTGTLTISFGTYTPASSTTPPTGNTFTPNTAQNPVNITIDSSNNTLAGIASAINASNSGVSATILNDGTTNHLVITSTSSGTANSLKISVADSDGNNSDTSGLSQLAYDPTAAAGNGQNLTQLQAPQDAKLTVDGIPVVKSSNTITDAISGVTLNLLSTTSSSSGANLSVASNTATAQASITSFVNAYNALNTTLRSLTAYDPTGQNSGPLLGDATTRGIMTQIQSVMTKAVTSTGAITSLSQIGVQFQATGQLSLNTTTLTSAMASNFSAIANLFTSSATTTDPQVRYLGSTNMTQAGTYAVNLSQLGTSAANAVGTINGVAATSYGTDLVGATSDPSEGLDLNITGGAVGARGTVTYTVGYASQLNNLITNLLSSTGPIAARTKWHTKFDYRP